jgi:hypothetical protein
LDALSQRFFKLSLQLLTRYDTWINAGLKLRAEKDTQAQQQQQQQQQSTSPIATVPATSATTTTAPGTSRTTTGISSPSAVVPSPSSTPVETSPDMSFWMNVDIRQLTAVIKDTETLIGKVSTERKKQ